MEREREKGLKAIIWKSNQHKIYVKKLSRICSQEEELMSNCCEEHKYLATSPVKTKSCNQTKVLQSLIGTKYSFHC